MTGRAVTAETAVVIVALVLACSGQPTQPGKVPNTTPATLVTGVTIDGPLTIAPGQTVQFTATGSLSHGTTEDETRKVMWTALPASVLTITRDTGQATALAAGDVTIHATYPGGVSCCQSQIARTVLPPNTYRLTGKVLESGLPVPSAAITVLSGIGAGLSTATDDDGAYRLYGVAGAIQVRFSKAGYDDIVKTFTAIQNDVLDFPEARQTAGIPSLAGTYTLTLTADPACPTVPLNGIAALPDDFRQARSYAAILTQNGPSLIVTLTDPQIVTTQNHFSGRVAPDGIEFQIGSPGYYGYYYGGIAEQVSATQEFEFSGLLRAHRSGSALTGALNGLLEVLTPPHTTAQCLAPNHQVALTRSPQPSGHR